MAEGFKRHFLRDKEVKQLLSWIQEKAKINTQTLVGANPHIEFAESKTITIYLINDKPLFAKKDGLTFPTLNFEDITKFLPQVVVNMGAVPHVCNGADVMAPGIVNVKGNFAKDDFVVVTDEKHEKPLAIGAALYDSESMKSLKQGKTIKNIHFVGDSLWQLLKKLR